MYPEFNQRGIPRIPSIAAALALFALGVACENDTTTLGGADGSDGSDGSVEQLVVASRSPRVKYKSGARYAGDLAAALDLPRDSVCRELGRYDCVDEVHRIVLGGVEPYTLGVRDPLPSIAATAPIAQDRVALAACTERIERDREASEPVFLTTVNVDAPTLQQLEATARRFYDRILRRDATPDEVSALAQFHSTVANETGGGAAATHDWAILSCFMVATTLESIFY